MLRNNNIFIMGDYMEKRRDSLKTLLQAKAYRKLLNDVEARKIEEYEAYYRKYDDFNFDYDEYETDFDNSQEVPEPPKGYLFWLNEGKRSEEKESEMIEEGKLQSRLKRLQEPTLEDVADIIYSEAIGLNYMGIETIFERIVYTQSPELWNNNAISKLIEEYDMALQDGEVISMLGEAYGKLGIPVDKLPEIGIQDMNFISGYIQNFPAELEENEMNFLFNIYGYNYTVSENDIIREGNPNYEHYINLYNLVERAQREVDLRHAKEAQDALKGRTQKIAEAEALVDQQQGQQQE